MAGIRLILFVAVMGGLTLLLASNWSPTLALKFLGMETRPLPLSIWILFSTFSGAFTTLLVSSLYQISNYFVPQRQQTSKPRYTPGRTESRRTAEVPSRPKPSQTTNTQRQQPPTMSVEDEWLRGQSDDWEFEEEEVDEPRPSPSTTETRETRETRDRSSYNPEQQPKNSRSVDSGYSYSSREPKNSGVGKAESIYDAEYRVIIPPYQAQADNNEEVNSTINSPTNKQVNTQDNDDDDEWEFLDEK
ncbi:MAG: LapA family protein [Scytonematopsis contorta HA4267-MV1]|jgi:hypothetical protein|nr:LapA family protein [Scytonematopsis contorta HA4267-MV1]